jgi:predicted CoA-binding protein
MSSKVNNAMASTLQDRVNDFLSQKRIAVAGVSRNAKSPGAANVIYRRLRENGYQVYAINPNADEVEGDRCYHSVKDLPDPVDGIVIATPATATEAVVHDCAEAGIRRVWMHNGIHSLGTSVSKNAVEYCQQHNMSVIAGACPLMYGKPSDGFHRFIRRVMGVFGRLPN